jgi:hypothetical protein
MINVQFSMFNERKDVVISTINLARWNKENLTWKTGLLLIRVG